MNQRTLRSITLLSALFVLPATSLRAQTAPAVRPAPKEIAVTFDDLPVGGRDIGVERLRAMTTALLAAVRRSGVPAVGFVNESKLHRSGELELRTAILKEWVDAGLELGNHTFSHPSLHQTELAAFQDDVVRGEAITRTLLEAKSPELRYFRHPFLRTGHTLEVKAQFEAFLKERGYTVAPVTIENADYVFAAIYADAILRDDRDAMRRIAEAYLAFTAAQFDFWEGVSEALLGRQLRHVLLLHANQMNADTFDELADLVRRRGYRFVTLEEALRDEAYALPDRYAGPAGVSWLYRWAHTKGVDLNWREEPVPPAWVQELYENRGTN